MRPAFDPLAFDYPTMTIYLFVTFIYYLHVTTRPVTSRLMPYQLWQLCSFCFSVSFDFSSDSIIYMAATGLCLQSKLHNLKFCGGLFF